MHFRCLSMGKITSILGLFTTRDMIDIVCLHNCEGGGDWQQALHNVKHGLWSWATSISIEGRVHNFGLGVSRGFGCSIWVYPLVIRERKTYREQCGRKKQMWKELGRPRFSSVKQNHIPSMKGNLRLGTEELKVAIHKNMANHCVTLTNK